MVARNSSDYQLDVGLSRTGCSLVMMFSSVSTRLPVKKVPWSLPWGRRAESASFLPERESR